jgi:hypothetical protein
MCRLDELNSDGPTPAAVYSVPSFVSVVPEQECQFLCAYQEVERLVAGMAFLKNTANNTLDSYRRLPTHMPVHWYWHP